MAGTLNGRETNTEIFIEGRMERRSSMRLRWPQGGLRMGPVLVTIVAGGVLTWASPALTNGGGEDEIKEKVEWASTARVTIDQAVNAALAKVPGTVIEAELEEVKRVTWEVEVVTDDGKVMEVLVDVDTGAVVSVEEKQPEDAKEQGNGKENGQGKEGVKKEAGGKPGMGGMMRHGGMMQGCGKGRAGGMSGGCGGSGSKPTEKGD